MLNSQTIDFRPSERLATVWDMTWDGSNWTINRHVTYQNLSDGVISLLAEMCETWPDVSSDVYHDWRGPNGTRRYWVTYSLERTIGNLYEGD